MAAGLEQSRRELAGHAEQVQKKAFTNWVNSHLMKAGQKINDLYEDFKDGTKLLLLLELLTGEKLRRERGKMRVHKLQNVQCALDFLQKDKQIKLVNIRNDEIVDGNPKLILGLVWTLILHFQISHSLQSREEVSDEAPTPVVSANLKVLKEQLLDWVRRATEGYEDVNVTNFHTSWRDGLAFCAIIDRHRPDILNYDDCDPEKPMENLAKAFEVAEEELGIIRIVDPEDICVEKPDEKAVMTYVSFLQHAFPTMPPPHRKKTPAVSLDDYRQLFQDTKEWVDQRTTQVKDRSFPSTVKETEALVASFQKWQSGEVPVKRRDMDTLSDLYTQLNKPRKQRSPVSPAVPTDLTFPPLELDWTYLTTESKLYNSALQEELQRLKNLEALAEKILSDCDAHSSLLDHLEGRVKEFESNCTSLPAQEAARLAGEIQRELKSLGRLVDALSPGVDELREGSYHNLDTVEQRVGELQSRFSSLGPRLEVAQSALSEVETVVAMETSLEELETWLVSCGKFADNQQILLQIEEHKVFQLEKLAAAEERISEINSSPPPPGLEDKVADINSRWEQIVKQTKDRIAGLEPIAQTIQEFDSVKNPLEDWSLQEQEAFEGLPPLEVTEEQLRVQQEEMVVIREDVAARRDAMDKTEDLSERFIKEMELVQSQADRYARKLKSCDRAAAAVLAVRRSETQSREGSAELMEASVGEQARILRDQYEWFESSAKTRADQISDLLDRLSEFNKHYDVLRQFVKEGNELLEEQKSLGGSTATMKERMEVAQSFRSQIASKQPDVDSMLALGRAIIAEPNTSSGNDVIMKKLTGFIQDWSDLQLAWQNLYNEFHASLEQSKSLSDQLNTFNRDLGELEHASDATLPGTVTMVALDSELEAIQAAFSTEVVQPLEERRAVYHTLKSSASLLPDPQVADNAFEKFDVVATSVEKLRDELSEVVSDAKAWWHTCEGVREWVSEALGELANERPIAGSVDIVEQQLARIQKLSEEAKTHSAEVEKALTSLSALSTHTSVINPDPVIKYRDDLRSNWERLSQEVEAREELAEAAQGHLGTYATLSTPFTVWLSGAEIRLGSFGPMPRMKDILLTTAEEFEAFTEDVQSHGKEVEDVERTSSQFLNCAKLYQAQLVDYSHWVGPEEGGKLSEYTVDVQSLDNLEPPVDHTFSFEGEDYQNGITVVSGDSKSARDRYDNLLASVMQQRERLLEAKSRRLELDTALEALLPRLSDLEQRFEDVVGEDDGEPGRIQEKVEIVKALEVECIALEPCLQDLQSAYSLWTDMAEGEEEVGVEDDALEEKGEAEKRYQHLLEKLRGHREALEAELSDARAFHEALTDFVSWLRETERNIQRDDPLKLEEEELKEGLEHLKVVEADIRAHVAPYEALCMQCRDFIERGSQDTDELQRKLDNLEQRWNGLAFVNDDIEAIQETIPKLNAFYTSYGGISSGVDGVLERLQTSSVSAASTDSLKERNEQLQAMVAEVGDCRSQFEALLGSCELLETPFDQTKFESDVSLLQEKMALCDTVANEKQEKLKGLGKKLRPMEDLFHEFKTWMSETEVKVAALSLTASEDEERKQQVEDTQAVVQDVSEHTVTLSKLTEAVSDLKSLVEEADEKLLDSELHHVTCRYHNLNFSCRSCTVDHWLDDRARQLATMAPTAVIGAPLQEQIQEAEEFMRVVKEYLPEVENLGSLAAHYKELARDTHLATGIGGVGDDRSGGSGSPEAKMVETWRRYEELKATAAERAGMLCSFLPAVQQYESSQSAWSTLLCGWEAAAASLPPPGAKPETIQGQREGVQLLQQSIADHELELASLKKGGEKLCEGPPSEQDYNTKLTRLSTSGAAEGATATAEAPRLGQTRLNDTLSDYETRLEELRKKLCGAEASLKAQLERAAQFQCAVQDLLAWSLEAAGEAESLKVIDPSSTAINEQELKCQALLDKQSSRSPEKEELTALSDALTSHLPDGNPDVEHLRRQLPELNTTWSDLSDRLEQQQADLALAHNLAKSYEKATQKLLPWVPGTLEHLKGLGPPPAEPEAVEARKSMIEELKSEYNSLASAYATSQESGRLLAETCHDPEQRGVLEDQVTRLHDDWEELGQLFKDHLQKLTEALVQAQEYQSIASGLERWTDGMLESMGSQGLIAARVKLIQSQVEGFKPIVDDVSSYTSMVEQARTMGTTLMKESDPEEQEKIQARLEVVTSRFSQLQEAVQERMANLENALQKAVVYEERSNGFERWLGEAEGRLEAWEPFPIASQPMMKHVEALKEFTEDVESHAPILDDVTSSEATLFASDLPTIQICEEHLFPPSLSEHVSKLTPTSTHEDRYMESSVDPVTESSVDKPVLPAWLERPGAPEAVEVGKDLRERYENLQLRIKDQRDEATNLSEKVLLYETNYNDFSSWLTEEQTKVSSYPPVFTLEELSEQLEQVENHQRIFTSHKPSLDTINATGTSLIDSCQDELSRDSCRVKLSELNEAWEQAVSDLNSRQEHLRQGIAVAERYKELHDAFDVWLTDSESRMKQPVQSQGDPQRIRQQLDEVKALHEEVLRHQPQLDEASEAGKDQERFASATPSVLQDLGYTALQERYEALKSCTDDRLSALESSLDRVCRLRDKLAEILGRLEGWCGRLTRHPPPHVTAAEVERQMKELDELGGTVEELQPVIVQALEEIGNFTSCEESSPSTYDEGLPSGADLQQLVSDVSTNNSRVGDLLGHWKDLLSASLENARRFDTDRSSLSSWIRSKTDELAAADPVAGRPEAVEKQLEVLQATLEDISEHQELLTSLNSLGHVMMDSAAPEDSLALGGQLERLQEEFESLRGKAEERRKVLEEGLSRARQFASDWAKAMDAIARKRNELGQFVSVGVEIDTVKNQLEEYKEYEASLATLKPQITMVTSQGKQLRESCAVVDAPFITKQLDQLHAAWSGLHSDSLGRKHLLEDALLQLGQFHEALAELLAWIADCTAKLEDAKPPGTRPHVVEAHIQELEGMESGIASHKASVASLNAAAEKLLLSSSAEATAEIQEDIADLNDRWASLQAAATEKRAALTAALNKARNFHDDWKKLVAWLSEIETKVFTDWKPSALPETCTADLTKHQVLTSEVEWHSGETEGLERAAAEVKVQGTPDEQRMVDRLVSDVERRWEDLNFGLEERQVQLEHAKSKADEFDQFFQLVRDQLATCEPKKEPIHCDVHALRQQLEEHKEFMHHMAEVEKKLDELDGLGQLLSLDCVTGDRDVIQQKIADLRTRWELLNSAAMDRLSSLEESLLSLGEFEEAYQELWAWLQNTLGQVGEGEPITGDPDAVATQLAKLKTLQKQLGSRHSSHNAVQHAGKALMKQKAGEDRVILKKKLADLNTEWEKVCQVSVARQDKLEAAYREIGQFRSYLGPLRSWMAKVLPSLDESEPIHGDMETVESLMAQHAAFQRELGFHQKNVDAAKESGGHLISEVLDNPEVTQQDLEELNSMWDNVCEKSVRKQDQLEEAYKAAKEYEMRCAELLSWMEGECDDLQSLPPPDEDVGTLQEQMEDHQAFSQKVASRQLEYDQLLADGHHLLHVAHPLAVPFLHDKIQQLEENWVDLRGRVGARSEALASSLLELNGLQDMLDKLLQWLGDSEANMAEAEAQPVGNDLATVEQQLTEHEGFQEDMATQQPNMDALNKAAKKQKQAHPHANPELNKKISSLYKHWQRLWLRSSERHRQLLEARTRLKDIALARSFDFDKWKQRFMSWVHQQKLRVNDLFRRFDSNHDGILTRAEFMKGLKASGLAMTQIEMEKVADVFDHNRDGMIDLNEILSMLKGTKQRRRVAVATTAELTDSQKIDHEIQRQVSSCSCSNSFQVTRVAEGQYRFGDSQKLRLVRILRSTVMVRVGGGWEPLEEFLGKHDPCRASSRTNVKLRNLLGASPGLTTAHFQSKTQTATAAKNAAMRKAAAEDESHASTCTHTHGSGRKETIVTTKTGKLKREGTPTRAEPIKHSLTKQTPTRVGTMGTPPRVGTPSKARSSPHGATPTRSSTPRGATPTRSSTPSGTTARSSPRGATPTRSSTPSGTAPRRGLRPPEGRQVTTPTGRGAATKNAGATPVRVSGSSSNGGTPGTVKPSRIPTPKSRIPVKDS